MWIDLQAAAVALAEGAGDDDRRELAGALLQAIVEQPSFGPADPLSRQAFALVLDAAPIARREPPAGSRPHLRGSPLPPKSGLVAPRVGGRPLDGRPRARRPGRVAAPEIVSPWTAEEWSDRLDVVAGLPVEPRPALLALVSGRRRAARCRPSCAS